MTNFKIQITNNKLTYKINREKVSCFVTDKILLIGRYFGDNLINIPNLISDQRQLIKDFIRNEEDVFNNAQIIDDTFDGYYISIIKLYNNYYILRDPLGFLAVYLHETDKLSILSDRQFLKINDNNLSSGIRLHPLYLFKKNRKIRGIYTIHLNLHDIIFRQENFYIKDINILSQRLIDFYLNRIHKILKIENSKHIYVSYSGGLDSSVALKLFNEAGIDTVAIIIMGQYKNTTQTNFMKLLKKMGVDYIYINIPRIEEIIEDIDFVLEVTEDETPMNISLALAQHWVFKEVPKKSYLALGQGADEVFGGYQKFLNIFRNRGVQDMINEIKKTLLFSYIVNFEREWKLSQAHNIRLLYPLISPGIVYITKHIPYHFLIKDTHDELRKHILRNIAKKLNLPKEIYLAKKKSLQYVSGSMDTLRKIAKMHGMKPYQYLQERQRKMKILQ